MFRELFNFEDVNTKPLNDEGESASHIIAKTRTRGSEKHQAELFSFFAQQLDRLEEDKGGRTALDVAAATDNVALLQFYQRS
jgi:hypothetical protein